MFEVKAKSVGKPVAPQIDDAFAKGFGVDSLAALKDGVRAQIQREYDQISRTKLKRELLDLTYRVDRQKLLTGLERAFHPGDARRQQRREDAVGDAGRVHDVAHQHEERRGEVGA